MGKQVEQAKLNKESRQWYTLLSCNLSNHRLSDTYVLFRRNVTSPLCLETNYDSTCWLQRLAGRKKSVQSNRNWSKLASFATTDITVVAQPSWSREYSPYHTIKAIKVDLSKWRIDAAGGRWVSRVCATLKALLWSSDTGFTKWVQ